jgi:hypothetical protein
MPTLSIFAEIGPCRQTLKEFCSSSKLSKTVNNQKRRIVFHYEKKIYIKKIDTHPIYRVFRVRSINLTIMTLKEEDKTLKICKKFKS